MTQSTQEERDIAAQAQRESCPLNDPRANYPLAETAREAQRAGRGRSNA